ncbi:hypothetical protein DID73_02485 [Candidatus Marinamargulisbacteria bacterium SCGC AG-343-K17]|nr:hypothetical protein DID73_02485 [Candidatus Marinamargulisbacteria bacterium SCGC AG-343-K17]
MDSQDHVKLNRLSGNYIAAVNEILKLSDHNRTPYLLDLAFIKLTYQQYEESLTFFLTYLSRTKPKTLNKMGQFIASQLFTVFPDSTPLNQITHYYLCDAPPKKSG